MIDDRQTQAIAVGTGLHQRLALLLDGPAVDDLSTGVVLHRINQILSASATTNEVAEIKAMVEDLAPKSYDGPPRNRHERRKAAKRKRR